MTSPLGFSMGERKVSIVIPSHLRLLHEHSSMAGVRFNAKSPYEAANLRPPPARRMGITEPDTRRCRFKKTHDPLFSLFWLPMTQSASRIQVIAAQEWELSMFT